MSRTDTLHFGNKEFPIRGMTIGQLSEIERAIVGHRKAADDGGNVLMAQQVIAAAIKRDHPDIEIAQIEATPQELTAAMKQVLAVAGFEVESV